MLKRLSLNKISKMTLFILLLFLFCIYPKQTKYNLDNYVEIKEDEIKVVLVKNDHNESLASEIMDFVQNNFEEKKYITIKFEKE